HLPLRGTLFRHAGEGWGEGPLRPRRTSARRGAGDVDHGHPLLLVIPAVEALDAGDFDLVEAEEAGDVERGRLVGLADLGRPFFLLVQRLDADELSFLVVVEIGARSSAQ